MRAHGPKFRNSPAWAILLHLLLPGLGHVYWREYLFGIFIFLVALVAAVLFIVSLFIHLPLGARLIMYGLPIVFYLFSFVDLVRTVRSRAAERVQSARRAGVFLAVGLGFELLVPVAPVNFAIYNFPDVFVLKTNGLSPIYREGDLLKASRLAYKVNSLVLDNPIIHSLPNRFAIVRFSVQNGEKCGIVIGLPGENVEIVQGVVVADNTPQLASPAAGQLLHGDWPLTRTGNYSVLVAVPYLGSIDKVYDVPLTQLIGKVEKLL
jgi:signal peptidase I